MPVASVPDTNLPMEKYSIHKMKKALGHTTNKNILVAKFSF